MSKGDLRLRWQVFNGVKSLFEQDIKGMTLDSVSDSSLFGI